MKPLRITMRARYLLLFVAYTLMFLLMGLVGLWRLN